MNRPDRRAVYPRRHLPAALGRHEVRRHRAGAKRLNHPIVGPMTFTYETMELAADEGLYLIVCGTAPGSPDADTLNLLASWHATGNAENAALKQS
jgi:MmyB-like transcription regulator ligand binding domain